MNTINHLKISIVFAMFIGASLSEPHTGNDRPSQRYLDSHVVPYLGRKWEDLAIQLLPATDAFYVRQIKQDRHDVAEYTKQFLYKWISLSYPNGSDHEITWNNLIKKLARNPVSLGYLASQIKAKLLPDDVVKPKESAVHVVPQLSPNLPDDAVKPKESAVHVVPQLSPNLPVNISDTRGARGRDETDHEGDKIGGEMTPYEKIRKTLPAYGVIINNQNFDNEKKNRKGSEEDVYSIKQLTKLNIEFEHELSDLTADQMEGALKFLATKDLNSLDKSKLGHGEGALKLLGVSEDKIKLCENFDQIKGLWISQKNSLKSFKNYSCLMVFILTHGSDEGLQGKDSKFTTVQNLSQVFNRKQCKELEGMPKVFFIQACRGTNLDVHTDDPSGDQDYNTDEDDETTSFKIPQGADFLFVYAAPPDCKALRNKIDGSPFIQELVEVLSQTRQHNYHLEESLLAVKHKVAKRDFNVKGEKGIVKVIPSVVSQMRGKIEFDLNDK